MQLADAGLMVSLKHFTLCISSPPCGCGSAQMSLSSGLHSVTFRRTHCWCEAVDDQPPEGR